MTSGKGLAIAVAVVASKSVELSVMIGKFAVSSPMLQVPMKNQLNKLAVTIQAQGAASVVITRFAYIGGHFSARLYQSRVLAVANRLRLSLKRHGYNKALRIVIRGGSTHAGQRASCQ